MADNERAIPPEQGAGAWLVAEGSPSPQEDPDPYRAEGVENLTYNNPYASEVERVWFDDKIVYALDCGEVELDFDEQRVARGNAVAQEYQVVYAVELDEQGKLKDGEEPEYVEGQYNIYDSVPGMDNYSPLWQFNYVVVPRDYEPNTLRSERACLAAGYPIQKSTVAEN